MKHTTYMKLGRVGTWLEEIDPYVMSMKDISFHSLFQYVCPCFSMYMRPETETLFLFAPPVKWSLSIATRRWSVCTPTLLKQNKSFQLYIVLFSICHSEENNSTTLKKRRILRITQGLESEISDKCLFPLSLLKSSSASRVSGKKERNFIFQQENFLCLHEWINTSGVPSWKMLGFK